MPIRVMAHFYAGSGTAIHPVVAIYCGGKRKATYGTAPDQVPGFNTPGGLDAGTMWRVADVTMTSGGTDARSRRFIRRRRPPGTTSPRTTPRLASVVVVVAALDRDQRLADPHARLVATLG